MRNTMALASQVLTARTYGGMFSICLLLLFLQCTDSQALVNPMFEKEEVGYPRNTIVDYKYLKTWLYEYASMGDNFRDCNAHAFRCSRFHGNWLNKLSVVAMDPKTSDDEHRAIVHLASAFYTTDTKSVCIGLDPMGESAHIAAYLKILRSARGLRPDASDTAWPSSGPLGPKLLPKYIAAVLEKHPELSVDIAQTLEVYGPFALKEAGTLLPLLLSEDRKVVAAAQSAIRKMDPSGLAHLCQFDDKQMPTPLQQQAIRQAIEKLPIVDKRESDGSEQSLLSKQFEVLWKYQLMRQHERTRQYEMIRRGGRKGAKVSLSMFDHELAKQFCDEHLPGKWFRAIVCAKMDYEMNTHEFYMFSPVLASTLYTKPGAHDELMELLRDDDPQIVEGAMTIICGIRKITDGQEYDRNGERVVPDVMTNQFVQALERHPYLGVSVAWCLRDYGAHASKHAEVLVPYLLSDEEYVVTAMSAVITRINPELAKSLEVTREEFMFLDEHRQELKPLTARQRDLIQRYLAVPADQAVPDRSTE